jgi:hypothetical protein
MRGNKRCAGSNVFEVAFGGLTVGLGKWLGHTMAFAILAEAEASTLANMYAKERSTGTSKSNCVGDQKVMWIEIT